MAIRSWITAPWFLSIFCMVQQVVCEQLGITAHQWEENLRIRQQLISIEQNLTENIFHKSRCNISEGTS
jgi:hypothetical protein